MNNFIRNKRIMFPIFITLAVIVIAIIVFILIGINPGKKQRVAEIDLGATSANYSTNVVEANEVEANEVEANEVDNKREDENEVLNYTENTVNEGKDDDEINYNGEKIYLDTANEFIEGLKDEEAMREFVDNHLDIKAYIACCNINGEDSQFVEEYQNTDFDDEDSERIIDNFTKLSNEENAKLTALTEPRQSG